VIPKGQQIEGIATIVAFPSALSALQNSSTNEREETARSGMKMNFPFDVDFESPFRISKSISSVSINGKPFTNHYMQDQTLHKKSYYSIICKKAMFRHLTPFSLATFIVLQKDQYHNMISALGYSIA
jgi:hypothetical protein